MEREFPLHFASLHALFCFREGPTQCLTFVTGQLPRSSPRCPRPATAKHFGPEGITTASGASLRDLAKRKGIDLSTVIADLNAMAKDSAIFAPL
jgi:hypothetical protein